MSASDFLSADANAELNSNPVTGDMLGRDFSLSNDALRSYAQTAAGVGGAAAAAAGCTAVGVPGVLCAPLGRFLGETAFALFARVASRVRRARKETPEQFFSHTLEIKNQAGETKPQVWAAAPMRILAVLDYATERRALVARTHTLEPQAASSFLSRRGAPSLSEMAKAHGWLGNATRWDRWTSRHLNDEDVWRNPGDENLSAGARVIFGDDRNYQVLETEQLITSPGGPPSPPGQIDFGLIGETPQAIELARQAQTVMRQNADALFTHAQERGASLFGEGVTEQLGGTKTKLFRLPSGIQAGAWLAASEAGAPSKGGGAGAVVLVLLAIVVLAGLRD